MNNPQGEKKVKDDGNKKKSARALSKKINHNLITLMSHEIKPDKKNDTPDSFVTIDRTMESHLCEMFKSY